MRNYSVDEISEMLVDSILQEQFFDKKNLIPKVRAYIKTMVDLKNTPKNYNKIESPTVQAKRLRTIEQKQTEVYFWKDVVETLVSESQMNEYYHQLNARLVTKGFKEP